MAVIAHLLWSFASALVGALVSLALNRWARGWALKTRVLVAVAGATLPTFGVVILLAYPGMSSLLLSPDEFLKSFALQVLLIVVVSAPIAWLLSRRARKPLPTDVFD
jgi:hypothetical protein